MLRSMASKVAWVGRTASMVFGLALVLALVFGVATMAFAANGNNFVLGVLTNSATKVTRLVGNVAGGPALQVQNTNTAAGSTTLQLGVAANKPPMTVNSSAKVANLNADKLDGIDSQTLGITMSSNYDKLSDCITPGTFSACAPVVVTFPAGKEYNISVWSNFSISTPNAGNARYCSGVKGPPDSAAPTLSCIAWGQAPDGQHGEIDLAANYDESAAYSGQMFLLGPGRYVFSSVIASSQAVTDSDAYRARTMVLVMDAASPHKF